MAYVFCNKCGHRNPPTSGFCSSCGSVLDNIDDRTVTLINVDPLQESPTAEDDIVVHMADLPSGNATLVVRNGPQAGVALALDAPVTTLGRHQDSEISLDDITVSRRHAEVEHRADEHEPLDPGETSVSLTVDELARASGLTARQLGELERYGLLHGEQAGSTTYYDEHGLLVARTAASFLAHGVEPRHLRMYKVAAEREASFYEQLVLPLAKQRNPKARRQARQTLGDLAKLGDTLHKALLRDALRDHLGG